MISEAPTTLLAESPSFTGYDQVARVYEQGRPDYPQAAATHFASVLGLQPGKVVLDLAAGTGKLTKALNETGASFLGVEPVDEMRAIFKEQFPGFSILEGSAEKIPLPPAHVDCVVVGTAFHWFDGERALSEIARVLKPKGKLGLIWNVFDAETSWVAEIRRLLKSESTHDSFAWKTAFEESTFFGPLLHLKYSYCYPGSVEDVLNRVISAKVMGTFSNKKKEDIVARTLHILDTHPITAGKTSFNIPYRIEIYWTQKL